MLASKSGGGAERLVLSCEGSVMRRYGVEKSVSREDVEGWRGLGSVLAGFLQKIEFKSEEPALVPIRPSTKDLYVR